MFRIPYTFRILLLSGLFLGLQCRVFTTEHEESINAFVNNVMDCRHVPGLTLGVVKGDESWSKGYGKADVKTGRAVTQDTLFPIGSLGKQFTMILLGNLIKDTSYTFDTKLSDIKGLKLDFVNENTTREATLSDLLSHRTGLSPIMDYGFIAGYPPEVDRAFLSGRSKYIPEVKPFRSTYNYNNMMYMLLGHVTEVLGKDTWENLVTSRVLEPNSMTSSKILKSAEDVLEGDVAKPYIMPDAEYIDGDPNIYTLTPLEPAGSIMATSTEMANWMRFIIRNATTDQGEHLLRHSDLQDAFQKMVDLPFLTLLQNLNKPRYPIDDVSDGYGYAFYTSTYRGERRLWHSGGLFSYVSLMWIFPDKQVGIFANVNGPGLPVHASYTLKMTLSYVADLALGLEPWLDRTTACTFPSPWRNSTSITIPPPKVYEINNMAEYAGWYGNPLLPDVHIAIRTDAEDGDYLSFDMNRIKGKLLPDKDPDSFQVKFVEPWEFAIERIVYGNYTITYPVNFHRNVDAALTAFNMTLNEANDVMDFVKGVTFIDAGDAEDEAPPGSQTDDDISAASFTPCCSIVSVISLLILLLV